MSIFLVCMRNSIKNNVVILGRLGISGSIFESQYQQNQLHRLITCICVILCSYIDATSLIPGVLEPFLFMIVSLFRSAELANLISLPTVPAKIVSHELQKFFAFNVRNLLLPIRLEQAWCCQ